MFLPKNIRPILVGLVLAALAGIVMAVSLKGSRTVSLDEQVRPLPAKTDVSLLGARFHELREGLPQWDLEAARADYDKDGRQAQLQQVRIIFEKSPTGSRITVAADAGEYDEQAGTLRLNGNVHGETADGARFTTDAIEYRSATSLLHTDRPVSFSQQRLALSARGMDMDVRDQKARFPKMVEAVVQGVSILKK